MTDAIDPLAQFRIDGRVAVVTGASSGLGSRFARVLDALGATVVVAARRLDRLQQLVTELAHGDALECDVSVAGASAALVDAVVDRHGRVDIVVANAGVTDVTPALREDHFAEVVNVDLVAPFELARAAARHMRKRGEGGSIILIASSAAFGSTPILPQASYVASKSGLVGLARELSVQWGRYSIRVNALCPGMFRSEMTSLLTDTDDLRAEFEKIVPMRRIGVEHELDGALAFLASDASSYMTGGALTVDGGGTL